MSGFFASTEFYVIASVLAAAILALCVKPASRGEVIEQLLEGTLCNTADENTSPRITMATNTDGKVMLTRSGLNGLTTHGAVSLVATRIGTDIIIEERIVQSSGGEPIDTALFTLDIMPAGRCHVKYNSDATGLFAAFTFTADADRPAMQRYLTH